MHERNGARRVSENDMRKMKRREHRENILKILDDTRKLVEAGKLSGLLILSRDPKSKHFFTDVALDERVHPTGDLYAWIGVLGALELELKEASLMAPCIQSDGSIIDPSTEAPEVIYIEEDPEDFE